MASVVHIKIGMTVKMIGKELREIMVGMVLIKQNG